MKRVIRILVGIMIGWVPLLLSSWVWLFVDKEPYSKVLNNYWYMISGDWDKLPD